MQRAGPYDKTVFAWLAQKVDTTRRERTSNMVDKGWIQIEAIHDRDRVQKRINGLRLDGDNTPSRVLLKSELEPPSKVEGLLNKGLWYKAVIVRGDHPYIESVWSPSVKAALEALLEATMEFAAIPGTGNFFTEGHYAWELERTKADYQIVPFAVPLGHESATGFDAAAVSAPTQTQAGPSSRAQPQGGRGRAQNWDGRSI
ncbi:hypothetical protein LTR91_013469 [Friedmanniomyces endolithicus]|uniref:Uncharacterized protein n=1 Tax=Friedmanniomyces endolithicus TaxID=329885 RepID=A0AAN6KDP6_9PEZI|nr:hypothetical protein LTS09_011584 [Friedmanniomyces endolithicus]KAK0355624.1 hypothetical protein LTR94_007819 [Friedmanniomyces endolithicus]KAK0793097.1 hypothetical protein LTR59_008266 [Friedmanniomyces endolithicus]KAK0800387.1 hypothetical protein LTR38_007225 [Friedmanniomyces endolithicus]KAK0806130.1 hypothetical protein LTR75_007095 [Friedmanniomyces endolithicus]